MFPFSLHPATLPHRRAWLQQLPADDPRLASILDLQGLNLLKAGKPADAEPILRECVDISAQKEADAWTLFSARSLLGGSLLAQKKYQEAESLLKDGYAGMKAPERRSRRRFP